jgi:HK97 family phage major capsid protein
MTATLTPEQMTENLLARVKEIVSTSNTETIAKMKADQEAFAASFKADMLAAQAKHVVSGLDPKSKEVKEYSVMRLIKGAQAANKRGDIAMKEICPMEFELHEATLKQMKDMNASTDSLGGYLVPAQVMQANILPLMQEALILQSLGVTFMDGLSGSPVEIPKDTGALTGFWVNHDTTSSPSAVTSSDSSFGQIKMTPKTAAARTVLSDRLINQSTPAAEGIIRTKIARDLNLLIEIAAINGTGADGQPRGLLQTDGIDTSVSVGSVSAATSYDKFIDMIVALFTNTKGNVMSPKWLMDRTTWGSLMKVKDPTDNTQPKARRLLTAAPEKYLIGYEYVASGNAPASTLVLGDWSNMIVGRWGGLVIKVDSLSVLGRLQTQVLASTELDTQVSYGQSFVKGTSVSA